MINNKEKYLNYLLLFVAICQFFVTLYFNIFEADIHLGIDSSWDYLKTIIVAKNHGIYPLDAISDTTAPLIDRQFILAMPLYMIFKNINIAYAVTNVIFTGAIVYNIVRLMQGKEFSKTEILLVVNLFLCSFMLNDFAWQNDLGYFSVVLGMVAMLMLPLIISRFVITFVKNDWRILLKWQSLCVYAVTILIVIGRVLGGALGLTYRDSIENWVSAEKFWSNLGNQFLGYMLLSGGIPNLGVSISPISA